MPADTNPQGDIFGGWLLSQMDLAGLTVAARQAQGRVVTAAITAMSFDRRVFVGDEVTCFAEVIDVGRSSIDVKVESWVRRGVSDERIKVTEGHFTYVAIDGHHRPRAVSHDCRPVPAAAPCRTKARHTHGAPAALRV